MNILVLCHGNINRSPACAAVLRAEFPQLKVRSAGFSKEGLRAAKKMRDAFPYPMEEHRSQRVTLELVMWSDMVIVMDGGNRKRFLEEFPYSGSKLHGLYEWTNLTRIPDPAFMRADSHEFLAVVKHIVQASLRLGKELTS